ncbi:hypothetical protein CERSUDRAFT_110738 [Gelatoporia subvermispora B]|uniref:F-box domain-containing protein n=1 Tax=Ceriporiopsis subvermispora (strain B) TaxID=914234 RepID=M2RUQ5_CERS8|nr:hypothetical protein CERSUDRAFT_110738 [Gelatoporia subvermispora B]
MHSTPWYTLPAEMKLSVVDHLDLDDVKALALVNKQAYHLCVPSKFRSVRITSLEALQSYLSEVPAAYNQYIHRLYISTKHKNERDLSYSRTAATLAVTQLLSSCSQVEQLTLSLAGSLTKAVIPCFGKMPYLTNLCINHCGDEQRTPLSERLIVSIAAATPKLSHLSLDRITRSMMHAPELVGKPPFIPLVAGDEDIPDHPVLGSELRLPSLLRIPTLKKLRIRDTHLGDPLWASTTVSCSLEMLDLGSCYHVSPEFNRTCTERIMGNVGHTVDDFTLSSPLSTKVADYSKDKENPLKRLRKIHLTPLFPVENIVDTLETFSESPVEQLSVQCHEDDVEDFCTALESFLGRRAQQSENSLFQHLSKIVVDTVSDISDGLFGAFDTATRAASATATAEADAPEAVKRLQELFRQLRLNDATTGAEPAHCTDGTTKDATIAESQKPILAVVTEGI